MNSVITKRKELYEIRSHFLRQVFDLQYRSICLSLAKHLKKRDLSQKSILDVGSGKSPYRKMFTPHQEYKLLDPYHPSDYSNPSSIPTDKKFHLILLTEVLEHVENPSELLQQLKSHLEEDGEIWITVPFAARTHRVPTDYWRWTKDGLEKLIGKSGLKVHLMENRGTDLSAIIAKLMFLIFRWAKKPSTCLCATLLGTFSTLLLLPFAHLCLWLNIGSVDDPLGFFVIAKR